MSVKSEKVDHEKEKITDDISDTVVEDKPEDSEVDADKLAALRAKLAASAQPAPEQSIEVEDVPEEEPEEPIEVEMPPRILEEKKRSIRMGIIGSGQAGSRLAEAFYRLGYDALAFNTAQQDLEHIDMPDGNKIMLEYGLGGASKDPAIGHEAAQMYRDLISSQIRDKLASAELYVFCTSLGGGSGSGSIDTFIDIMSAVGKPIVVITVLPMTNEDAQTKKNSLDALGNLANKVQAKEIHNLIVVDNAKIETIFKDVGPMQFYQVSNKAIVDPLEVFNTYSTAPSHVKSLDPMEFGKILIDGGGLSLYGCMTVANYEEDTALAEAVIENLTSGLLAEGFNLKQTQYCGVMFLANKSVWDKLPSASINYAMSMVQDHAGTPLGVFRGIYEADIKEDVVKVYSFFSGLALPDPRVEELKAEVAAHSSTLKQKDVSRNMNLNIDTGTSETVSAAEKIKEKISKKKSKFSQFTKGIVDKRK